MSRPLRLMAVLAHPDDESLGFGPTLARYAAEGVETSLVMATPGQKGWKLGEYPGPEAVAAWRGRELERAAEALGIRHVTLLGYRDGELDRAPASAVIAAIAEQIRLHRPDVVLGFGLEGAYGHPDHIAVSQFATAAIVAAADRGGRTGPPPHRVAKLYHLAETREVIAAYQRAFGDLKSTVAGVERRFAGWNDWYPSARIDTRPYLGAVREAILSHRSQLRSYRGLLELPEDSWAEIFGEQSFVRVYSLVSAGREIESDLFAGLRSDALHPAEVAPT